MNAAYKMLEETGLVDAVKEYAKAKGFEVSCVFEYSAVKLEVTAQVVCKKTGKKATRTESLKEFIACKDDQSDRAVSMLKACVDEVASLVTEQLDDAFFEAFPSLDPSKKPWTAPPGEKKNYMVSTKVVKAGGTIHPGTPLYYEPQPKPTVPPADAGKRPKRLILD